MIFEPFRQDARDSSPKISKQQLIIVARKSRRGICINRSLGNPSEYVHLTVQVTNALFEYLTCVPVYFQVSLQSFPESLQLLRLNTCPKIVHRIEFMPEDQAWN
jgi:hypothetical protein